MDAALRIVLLLAGFTLVMLCVKIAWRSRREAPERVWALASYSALLLIPALRLLDFQTMVTRTSLLLYVVALVCGAVAARKFLTIRSEWGRARLAAARRATSRATTERRRGEDKLRSDDRLSQAGERADSRAMFDEGHLNETTATYDHRVEMRELQDDNRVHSHELQDDERVTARADEDRAL